MFTGSLLKLRYGVDVDTVVLRMRTNKLHESDFPREIKRSDEAVVSTSYFEPYALSV